MRKSLGWGGGYVLMRILRHKKHEIDSWSKNLSYQILISMHELHGS